MIKTSRLPIKYPLEKGFVIKNAFVENMGNFDNVYDDFISICLSNIPWAIYHLLMWKGEPLELAPFQMSIINMLWHKPFPLLLASRGASKSFILAVYAVIRAMLTPGSKIVIVAASFRQSKIVFDYIEQIYDHSPLLRACCSKGPEHKPDMYKLTIGDSTIIAVPLGNGEKIRGLRASVILADEIASIPYEVFQVVVRGFAAVSSNPIEAAKLKYDEELAIKEGRLKSRDVKRTMGNQIVYSGTANYQFNHLYKILKTHEYIIKNKIIGTARDLDRELIDTENEEMLDEDIHYKDYGIISLPYQGLPRGFMDEKQVAQSRLSMPKSMFQMEYECIFPTDSDGFFRRSAIEDATPKPGFSVEVSGKGDYEYVMGIDPARKTDNFAISVLKIMKDGKLRNVYCNSMNGKKWPEATRRVRNILKKFNVVRIAMDAGGGGTTIEDLLCDPNMLEPGDEPIWRYDDEEAFRYAGKHILDMVNFSSSWIAEANYGLVADIEHKRLLFPNRSRDNIISADDEDVWQEIDEQIVEMCMIVVTSTKTGIQHFDTPEIPAVQQGTIKSHQRKDRYSALLLSSYAARTYMTEGARIITPCSGGWIERI